MINGLVSVFNYIGKNWFIGLTVLAIIDFAWLALAGHQVAFSSLAQIVAIGSAGLILLACCNMVSVNTVSWFEESRRQEILNAVRLVERFVEVFLFMILGWVALRLFNHLCMTVPVPYADGMLAGWDKVVFGDLWNRYFRFVAETPMVNQIMYLSYTKLTPLSIIGFYFLFLTGRELAGRFFLYTFSTTALIATSVGLFFPARAAVATILDAPELLSAFEVTPGWYSIDIIANLRTQSGIIFDLNYLPGLTTFPSFHTAAGIVLVYSYRGSMMFIPAMLYTIVMVASTPVFGGHYFVDLIAGTVLALVVCRYFEKKPAFAGVFDKTQPASAQPAIGASARS